MTPIEITPEMISAGMDVLDPLGVIVPPSEKVVLIFMAMARLSPQFGRVLVVKDRGEE